MFYETQIKSVTTGGAIDVNGRSLQFIGYLPVKAGDTVFTDGRFIFGNASPKGNAIFDVPSGIPVLADYDSGGEDELRGYFNNRGKYKRYSIAGIDWLVNDDKNFKHDEGANIIDAELDDDGKLLTVEKKVTQIAEVDDTSNLLFYRYYGHFYFARSTQEYYSMLDFNRATRGLYTDQFYHQTLWVINPHGNLDYVKNTTPIVKQARRIMGVEYIPHEFIERAGGSIFRDCELAIKKDGEELETLKLSELVEVAEATALEYVNVTVQGYATADYIKSFANLLNFKINPDGKWELLFEIEIGAERDYPHPEATMYETSGGVVDGLRVLGYSTAAVHSYFIFKVDSDGNTEKIAERTSFMPLWLIDNIKIDDITIPFKIEGGVKTYSGASPPFVAVKTTFPYANLEIGSWGENLGTGEGYECWTTYTVWDSRLMPNAPDYDNDLEEVADFDFPVQDDYRAKIINCDEEIDQWQFGGISDADGKPVIGAILQDETDAHKWNMSLATLKGGSYLFGIHKDDDHEIDGALYKIDDKGGMEQVGDGLKNFRLRELKRISKAKK